MDDDDGDVCRVCRSGPEPGQPLFHPCRCSGSIRHVHQACLLAWLQASRKVACETCGARFHFTPVYAPDRPSTLPSTVLVVRAVQQLLAFTLLGLRAILVGGVWLALVPWMSIWTLRFYLALANSVAWTLAGRGAAMPDALGVAGGTLLIPGGGGGGGNSSSSNSGEPTMTTTAAEALATAVVSGLAELGRSTTAASSLLPDDDGSGGGLPSLPASSVLLAPLSSLPSDPSSSPVAAALVEASLTKEVAAVVAAAHATASLPSLPSSSSSPPASLGRLLTTLVWRDLYPGQQLLAGVVLTLLVGFLLREWATNAGAAAGRAVNDDEDEADLPLDLAAGDERARVDDDEEEEAVRERAVVERPPLAAAAAAAATATDAAVAVEATGQVVLAPPPRGEEVAVVAAGTRDIGPLALEVIGKDEAAAEEEEEEEEEEEKDKSAHVDREAFIRAKRAAFFDRRDAPAEAVASTAVDDVEAEVVAAPAGAPVVVVVAGPSSEVTRTRPGDDDDGGVGGGSAGPGEPVKASPALEVAGRRSLTASALTSARPAPAKSLSVVADPGSSASSTLVERDGRSVVPMPASIGVLQSLSDAGPVSPSSPTVLDEMGLPLPTVAHLGDSSSTATALGQVSDQAHPEDESLNQAPEERDSIRVPSPVAIPVKEDPMMPPLPPADHEDGRDAGPGQWFEVDDSEVEGAADGNTDDNDDDDDWEDMDGPAAAVEADGPVPVVPVARRRRPLAVERGPNPPPLMPLGLFRPAAAGAGQPNDEEAADEEGIDEQEDEPLGPDDIEGEREEGEEENGEEDGLDPANAALLQEEIDGLLEAVGLRGPMTGLLQNTTIITVVVSFFCALAIFVPLVLGKTVLLVDLRALAKVPLVPVRLIRLATDPAVGGLVELVRSRRPADLGEEVEGGPAVSSGILGGLVGRFQGGLPASFGAGWSSLTGRLPGSLTGHFSASANSTISSLPAWASSTVNRLSFDEAGSLGSALAFVGRFAQDGWAALVGLPTRLAQADNVGFFPFCQGDSVGDRVIAVAVGYIVLAAVVGAVFRLRARWARAVQVELEPAVTVVKLGVFMLIELVLFPFFCGALLHLSALPLLVDRPTLADFRILDGHPIVALGQHVLLGTIFMFGFANLLAFGRTALRPGVFFFIRDPSDPAFNPVNDILFKRTWPQLKKLLISAVMYATMLVSCVGLVGLTLRFGTPGGPVLPLRIAGHPPLTDIPVDLLFIHLGMPLLNDRFHPLARLKRALIAWLSATVDALRLTSYFFDAPKPPTWSDDDDDDDSVAESPVGPDLRDRINTPAKLAVDRLVGLLAPFGRRDFMQGVGGWARVPAVDHLRILPARRMFVRLDDDHAPLNGDELRLLVAINKKAVDAGRDPATDFGVVWLPGHVRSRVYLLLCALWASCLAVAALVVGTIGLGRLALRIVVLGDSEAHDGYALLAGSAILAGCVEVGLTTEIVLRRWTLARQVAKRRPRPFLRRSAVIRWARSLATGLLATVALGGIVPLTVGLVIETALLLPFRSSATDPAVIHLAEVWALGALALSCLIQLRPNLPPNGLLRELDLAYGHRRFRWSARRLLCRLLGPLLGVAAAAIILPWAAVALCSISSTDVARNARLSRLAHPAVLLGVLSFFASQRAWVAFGAWVGKMHEREYLVSMRLRNQGPSDDNSSTGTAQPMAIPADMVGLLL